VIEEELEYCEVCEIYLFKEELDRGLCDDCYVKYFQESDYVN
jgi:hypothetical protein